MPDRAQLEAAIGRNASYYLRRFEQIDSGRRIGWNWAAFFLSTAWFSYRGLGGWAALNLAAPWVAMLLVAFTMPFSFHLGMLFLIAYPVVFFVLVPLYADFLYYQRVKRAVAHEAEGGKPSPPTRPVSATVVGLAAVILPALVLLIYQGSRVDYTSRAQVSEAITLMASAKTPVAEYFADKGKWPDNLKQVAENTGGRYTERVEITSGAGAASGALVMTATMRTNGVRSEVAGKTVQYRSEDQGKTWVCSRGAVNGVDNKFLPAACR
jgi:type IV pilus assembly protein PilA